MARDKIRHYNAVPIDKSKRARNLKEIADAEAEEVKREYELLLESGNYTEADFDAYTQKLIEIQDGFTKSLIALYSNSSG